MREITFRGKRADNGEWVTGFYVELMGWGPYSAGYEEKKMHLIKGIYENGNNYSNEVDPSTVGQYTGLKDKNDKKIFDGDILGRDGYWSNVVEFQRIMPLDFVQYNNATGIPIYGYNSTIWEVIGNIHDNPELLKEDT